MMSIKTVNALSHYTDWTIGHVHSGALGWVAFMSLGAMYYLIPRLFGRARCTSVRLIEVHFWISTHRHRALYRARCGSPGSCRG